MKHFLLLLLISFLSCKSKESTTSGSIKKLFLEEQIEIGKPIWDYLHSNPYLLNSLGQIDFVRKIDSLKNIQATQLIKYKGKLDDETFYDETIGINYAFDKFILEYPIKHQTFTGEEVVLSENNKLRLKRNLDNFNDKKLLSNDALMDYIVSYISIESNKKLKSGIYRYLDNQQLRADWHTIEKTFKDQEVNEFWKQRYLYYQIDNFGIKNIDTFYNAFRASAKDPVSRKKIQDIYQSSKIGRESHIIETYKEIDGFDLEMHLFLPDSAVFKGDRPAIVYFHGGSWSEGKPDWFFETAEEYASQGWVATAAEYRIKGRHGTYPFDAVKDAKSAVRWLRKNSRKYSINPDKIVATGNSAGGQLSIATSLIDNWNEQTDDLSINSKPNTVIANAAVYDLTTNSNRWIREYSEYNLVEEISPNSLVRKTATKFLLIHGENDRNCPYETVVFFYEKMQSLGNNIELHSIKDGEHFIWFGQHSEEVSRITKNYIKKQSLE